MAFVVTKSDGSTLATVSTNSVNTLSSSITLHGRGKLRWGNEVNENFIHMLENFADTTAPFNPLEGQLWAQKTGSPLIGSPTPVTQVNFWNGSSWEPLLTAALGSDIYVNETGDIMTGDLILDNANLTVIGTGTNSPNLAVDVTGNMDVTGNVSINTSGSPRSTALSVDGNIQADDSVMTFTGNSSGFDLLINQGKGDFGIAPDIHKTLSSLLVAAKSSIHMNINTEGGVGAFYINTNSAIVDTLSETRIFQLSFNGNMQMAGNILYLGHLDSLNTDKSIFVNFYSEASGDVSTGIRRTAGEDGEFRITNNGEGNFVFNKGGDIGYFFQRDGITEFHIGNIGVNVYTKRISNVTDPVAQQDAATKNYVDNNSGGFSSGQTWQTVSGSRSYSTIYTNSTGDPIAVQVAGIGGFSPTETRLFVSSSGTPNIEISNFRLDEEETSYMTVSGIIPPGWRYRVLKTGSGDNTFELFWRELR